MRADVWQACVPLTNKRYPVIGEDAVATLGDQVTSALDALIVGVMFVGAAGVVNGVLVSRAMVMKRSAMYGCKLLCDASWPVVPFVGVVVAFVAVWATFVAVMS